MAIKLREGTEDLYISLEGDVSISEAATMYGSLKSHPDAFVTVDMANMEGIDTSIAQLILATIVKYGEKNLHVIPPPKAVMEVLDRVGLLSRFELEQDATHVSRVIEGV